MKRLMIRLCGTFLFLALLVSCGKPDTKLIGIAKFVAHPALDAVEKGIIDEIAKSKPEYKLDLQNSNADMSTAAQIAQRFKQEKVSVAVGIATPTAQALANQIKNIPVVFSAVTDPVSAGLVPSLEKGGANVTGTSDMTPVRQQLDLLRALQGNLKRLGHIYASGEANSAAIAKIVQAYCEENSIQYVEATVSNSSEVKQALLSIAPRIDGLYLGNDNTVFSALNAVAETALEKNLPVVTADPSSAESIPVLAAIGYDYYKVGTATGKIVVRILNGEKTADIPVYLPTESSDLLMVLNLDAAKKLKLTVPAEIVEKAAVVIKDGSLVRK